MNPPTAVADRPDTSTRHEPLGVVVVSYGSPDLLRRTLATLDWTVPVGAPASAGGRPDHPVDVPADVVVVVVDNFSTVANRAAVEALGREHGWHVVVMPDNRGFGAGCNAGVAAARELGCTAFLFLNPDALVAGDAVAALREHCAREPMTLVAPRMVDSTGRIVFRGSRLDLGNGRLGARLPAVDATGAPTVEWVTGACVLASAQLLDRIGGFDERYFLYWEDVDLSVRAVRAGGSVVVRTDLVATHDEGGTHAGDEAGLSPLYYRYNCRNRLLFGTHLLDRRGLLRWILRTPAASWDILLRGGRRQLLTSPGVLWAALRGSVAGLALAVPALVTGARPHVPDHGPGPTPDRRPLPVPRRIA